nr:hypothetical protein [Xylanimonas allomyrinae]
MLTAAARPDLVRRLVLLECDEGSGTPAGQARLGDFFRSWPVPFASRESAVQVLGGGPLARSWAADLEERAGGLFARFDADVMEATITAVAVPRWVEWESVDAPTLVVYAPDGMFSEDQKAAFVGRGRRVTRVDLARGSHDAHLDAFEEWAHALTGFLDGACEPAAAP